MHNVKVLRGIFLVLFLLVLGSGGVVTASAPVDGALGQAAGDVYYVSNDGSDGNNGLTPETAWETLDHVSDQTFEPGDAILFRRGDVWRETLYVTSSGTSEAWITYGAYGTGDRPRILGSEPATGWTQVSGNIWSSSTPLDNPYAGGYSYGEVFFELRDGTTHWGDQQDYDVSFSALTKEYDWTWNADTIYVYAASDPGSRYAAVEAPQRDSCVRLPNVDGNYVPDDAYVQYVAFDNLALMYAMRHGFYPGYNEIEAHGLRLTNCEIGFIGVKGGSSAYCIAAWHSDMLIQNNTIHDCGRRGISMNTYTDYTEGLTISNVVIDGNHFYNGFHTTSADISTLPGMGHTFTNITFSNNLVDDSTRWDASMNDGCAASSCTSNSLYVEANGNNYSNFYIYNNVIVGSTSRAMLLVDMSNVFVYHNTVYASHPGARPYSLITFNDVANIDLRNNIVYGTLPYNGGANDARCVMDQGTVSFSVRDYNLYHQDDLNQPFTGSENGVGGWDVFFSEWDSWRTDSGFETHSPEPQDPQFANSAGGNFRLSSGSPAIDAGVVIPGFNDDYIGDAPDLGAFEYTPALSLSASGGNQLIALTWTVDGPLPTAATWEINYEGEGSTVYMPVTGLISTTRAHTLTGLTNNVWYTVTLNAVDGGTPIFSDTVRAMPFDASTLSHVVYLPLVLR